MSNKDICDVCDKVITKKQLIEGVAEIRWKKWINFNGWSKRAHHIKCNMNSLGGQIG
jgi:hypothetical protein